MNFHMYWQILFQLRLAHSPGGATCKPQRERLQAAGYSSSNGR